MKTLQTYSVKASPVRKTDIAVIVNDENVIEFEVPSRPEMLKYTRSRVEEFARKMPFSAEEIDDIKLSVGEAIDNALLHGVCPLGTTFRVRTERNGEKLHIFVWDRGCGFDPNSVPPAPSDTFSEHGRGLMIMRALMDLVQVRSGDGGTCVEMVKAVSF